MSSQEKGESSDHKVTESSPLNILPSILPSLYFLLSVGAPFICPSFPSSGLFFHISFLICLFTPTLYFHMSLSLSPSFSLPPSPPLSPSPSLYLYPLFLSIYTPPLMGYKCFRTVIASGTRPACLLHTKIQALKQTHTNTHI